MEWSHTLLGQYDIGADTLAIDLARNFMDPVQAELAHVHEVTHATLGRTTDMGLATKPIYAHLKRFSHLDDQGQQRLAKALYDAQVLPQEGFATLMECLHLAGKVGKTKALEYARTKLPQDYLARFEQLSYSMDMSLRYREYFTQKISALAMETGFREVAPSQDLLRSPEKLENFLKQLDRNPTMRLQRINEVLRIKPWLVTKPIPEIAAECGIAFYEPASKEAIATYMNYIGGIAGLGGTYTAAMVNDAPGPQALIDAAQDAVLTNINHNFSKDAEFLMDETAMDWEAAQADCVMFDFWPYYGEREQLIEQASGLKPEVAFALFRRTGEKYIGFVPKDKAIELIDGPLTAKTLIAKPDAVDIASGDFTLSKTRQPDLVYYDHPKLLHEKVEQAKDKITSSQYLNLGTTQDHPYRIIALRVNEKRPLHVANAFGGGKIADILKAVEPGAVRMPDQTIKDDYRDVINDYFGFMGMPWQLDWVTMMLDKTEIKYR
jgi:hypothetical protein